MTLNPKEVQEQPQQAGGPAAPAAPQQPAAEKPKAKKQSGDKLKKAIEYVLSGTVDGKAIKEMPYSEAKAAIQENCHVSRSVAHHAYHAVKDAENKERGIVTKGSSKTKLEIVDEKAKSPDFIGDEFIEELPSIEQEPAKPADQQQQQEPTFDPDYMRDMLRGIHDLLLSKDGILGDKYGRPKEAIHQTSDQLARYLSKRVSPAQFEQYDTALLLLSYCTLLAGVLNEVRKDRELKAKRAKDDLIKT